MRAGGRRAGGVSGPNGPGRQNPHPPPYFYFILLAILLGGCTIPQAEISPEGILEVIGPASADPQAPLSDAWVSQGMSRDTILESRLQVEHIGGRAAYRVIADGRGFVLVRRTRASLLASPFLRWRWKMGKYDDGPHPVRLVIGFFGGDPASGSRGAQPFAFLGRNLPAHDRLITIQWGGKSLQRGSLETTPPPPRYTARGGTANTEKSWAENVDLSQLYRRLWPKDRLPRVQVIYIGLSVAASARLTAAAISELVLSR